MYNNAIIQTNYKPYIPPPRKKIAQEEGSQPENKGRIVTPNNYQDANGQNKPSTDTFTKNITPVSKINIKQLLIDFNSTLNAIGASEDVENEVKTYLGLVEHQSQKENPNKKMIVSNLKIAADVLDTYISETLNKPSKVVKDWVDALLMQNIDFKSDEKITKGAFESITGELPQTAKLAEKKLAQKAQKQDEVVEEQIKTQEENIQKTQDILTPALMVDVQDEKIKSLISESDEFVLTSPKKSLELLSEAFSIAQNLSDRSAMAEIYSKIAAVQNNLNNLPQALDCLHASTTLAYSIGDDFLKTQNHKQMGKIYDEAGYMQTALVHYFASIAVDGKLDDTENQADTLTNIGKMYTSRYAEDEAVDFYKDALELAKVTKNLDIMSNIFQNTALTFKNSGTTDKALNNYKNAAILSRKSGNEEQLAYIYEQAGDLMLQNNYTLRAADLYKKSYRIFEKINNQDNLDKLKEKLININ